MNSFQDSRYALPGLVAILVVLGIIAVGQLSLEPKRPFSSAPIKYSDSTPYHIESRLWQDPFYAIDKYEESQSDSSTILPVIQVAATAIREHLWSLRPTEDVIQEFVDCLHDHTTNFVRCDKLIDEKPICYGVLNTYNTMTNPSQDAGQ